MAHSHFIPSKSQKRLYMYANYMLFGDCFPSPLFSLTMSSVCVCVCVCACVRVSVSATLTCPSLDYTELYMHNKNAN